MEALFRTLGALASVQYVNYRVALKLRAIQTALLLDRVPCSQVPNLLLLSDRETEPQSAVSAAELERILAQLYGAWDHGPGGGDPKQAKATCMNFILMTFCCLSGGGLTSRMVLVFVGLFCAADPLEKIKCLLLLSGCKDNVSKDEFIAFLGVLTQIFSGLQEEFPVEAAEELWALAVSHSETCERSVGLSECARLLTLSRHFRWLPTWQKLAANEHSVHQLGCGSCLCKPVVGLRYQCVQCPRLHLCQCNKQVCMILVLRLTHIAREALSDYLLGLAAQLLAAVPDGFIWYFLFEASGRHTCPLPSLQQCHLTGTAATRVRGHRLDHQVEEHQTPPLPQTLWHQVLLCGAPNIERAQLMQDEVRTCSSGGVGGLSTRGCSLESISSGPALGQDLCRGAAHPSMTPPLHTIEDESVAKQQWLRELVQRKKELEEELRWVGQLRESKAEVRRLQSQVEELFSTRAALSEQLRGLLGKVQDMRPKEGQEEGQEGPDAAGFPSQWLGSETAWHTTPHRTQSAPRVARAAAALRTRCVAKETLV